MRIINDLNLKQQARDLGVDVWHTPSFLFLMMGFIIIISMTATYFISRNYNSPEIVVISETVVVITIFIIGNSIIRGVEQMAKLNKMKSEFVSVASHQLRTPLSAIRWQTELILSKFGEGLSEKQKDGIETISQLSARMARLVSDLLDVARIDQGRLVLKEVALDLENLVSEVVSDLTPLAKARNLSISIERKKDLSKVLGDQEKLKLVIENLISNSIKYTNKKSVIEINFYEDDDDVVFSIRDYGVGIPLSQQDQIFNKFFRSDNIIKYQTEGTGLGLYIAKNIVEQSGGKIWFSSEENAGSIFKFSIPRIKNNLDANS